MVTDNFNLESEGQLKGIIPVRVHGVGLDSSTKDFVVILRDDQGGKWLPIYVGPFEAQAISLELEKAKPSRPLTHDLMRNMLQTLGVGVTKVVINEIHDNTYFAKIGLRGDNILLDIDARPSDAIALALRMKAPIFAAEEVMRTAGISDKPEELEKKKSKEKSKIEELQDQLQRAIDAEEFEEAAKLRDRIRRLQEEEGDG